MRDSVNRGAYILSILLLYLDCGLFTPLAADQLRAVTEYTIRGHMGPEQELALQLEILRIAASIQRMMPPLVD
ncbi:hypothetical protein CABS01_17247 [Colletotrichum abscissum]|uniref:uncharacterized protein n=1 Tax=Colletotrichum abscissum TaxID=1671311 RepID=UPI0027D525D5|nr:uncharacterized protein CABS01_17247 [Colletotrichum abscissum]KAK1481648.1 hypothetical protein CABS01_17247 [Colletotrichum abscissum]